MTRSVHGITWTCVEPGRWHDPGGYELEYRHNDGAGWNLYGPEGIPFGRFLSTSFKVALEEASLYIIRANGRQVVVETNSGTWIEPRVPCRSEELVLTERWNELMQITRRVMAATHDPHWEYMGLTQLDADCIEYGLALVGQEILLSRKVAS